MTDANEKRYALVEKQREVITYSELWHGSAAFLKLGQSAVESRRLRSAGTPVAGAEDSGWAWQFLSSALFAAFALEAFLNHVGAQTVSNWSDLEPLSPAKKCRHLSLVLGVNLGEQGERPLQTLKSLFDFRNELAHGKSETVSYGPEEREVDDNLDAFLGVRPLTTWEAKVQTDKFALLARKDVERIIRALHDARPEPKEHLFYFGMHSSQASGLAVRSEPARKPG